MSSARLPLASTPPPTRRLPPGREVRRSSALSATLGADVRGARRLARPRLDPRRGRAARDGRDRRRLAPRRSSRCGPAGEPIEGDGVVWYRDLAAARARPLCAGARRLGARAGRRAASSLDVTGALLGDRDRRSRGRHGAAPADAHPPLPLGRRGRPRHGARAAARRRLLDRSVAQELGQYVWEVAVDRASAARRRPRRRRRARGSRGVKDIFFRKEILQAARAAEAALRRRHRRRRLARSRDRVLPRDAPRHHGRRDPREELHRRRARPGATRRSSARTTARPRAPRSTRRASSSTRSSRPISTSTSCSRSTGTSRSRTPTGRSSCRTSAPR